MILPPSFGVVGGSLRAVAGVAWFLATYAGPLAALKRFPFPRPTNIALGMAYLALVLVLCGVGALSIQVETDGYGRAIANALGRFEGTGSAVSLVGMGLWESGRHFVQVKHPKTIK